MQDKKGSNFGQFGGYAIAIVLSVGLTLGFLRLFPDWLTPVAQATIKQEVVMASNTPPETVARVPQRVGNFVSDAVNRVGPAVVRLDTERTVSTNIPQPFFDDPFSGVSLGKICHNFPGNINNGDKVRVLLWTVMG